MMKISPQSFQMNCSASFKKNAYKFCKQDFYIKLPGYGKDSRWAEKIVQTAEEAEMLIRRGWSFENVLKKISIGVSEANKIPLDLARREHTGILRTDRDGWKSESSWKGLPLITKYGKKFGNKKYNAYEARLDACIESPIRSVHQDVALTRPEVFAGVKQIRHGDSKNINGSFRLLSKLHSFVLKQYLSKDLNENDLKVINNAIAQIRWILAHTTPWERGSDSISNVYMKAMYKALGIKTYPPARGVSFDLEAFCTNLSDYRKNFYMYFEKKPEKFVQ